jgi:CheY-like chemotaxis protein
MQRLELTETLEQVGFRVVPVVSAEEALAVVNTEPDLRVIVTDVKLSSEDLSGFALA